LDHDFHDRFGLAPREYRAQSDARGEETEQVPAAVIQRPAAPRARVLLVEDDASMAQTLQWSLKQAGYQVLLAHSASEAIHQIRSRHVDAMVIDYRLPDGNGLDLLREARSQPRTARIAAAVFTADWSVENHAAEIASLGAMVGSKLCDLGEVSRLVATLCALSAGCGMF
jgi:CheY-like chemotaxis protein